MNKAFFINLIPAPRRIIMLNKTSMPWNQLTPITLDNPLTTPEGPIVTAFAQKVLSPRNITTNPSHKSIRIKLRKHNLKNILTTNNIEGYILDIEPDSILLRADSLQGFRHGLITLKQMIESTENEGLIPSARIIDWPALPFRGIHVDLAREIEYRHEHMLKIIENLAYLKLNTLHLYLENNFEYPSLDQRVIKKNSLSISQAKALKKHADFYGIDLIPQIATLGHMEHFLHHSYSELRENPKSSFNICPTHPKTKAFLAGMIHDVASAFSPRFIHVGYDESHSGVCPRCQQHGTPESILSDHLNWLNAEVKSHGARTMMYGDKFLSRDEFYRADAANAPSPEKAHAALKPVNRDIIITNWHYTAPYSETSKYLVKEGFEVHIASATNLYWHDTIPLHRSHHWIVDTFDKAIAEGVRGAFNTNWEYYRGQFFDNYWFFQALAAERAWTDAPHDYVAWGQRFSSRFWGVEKDIYSEMAGLAETMVLVRRNAFLDGHVLNIDIPAALNIYWPSWHQAAFDFTEVGDYLIRQAQMLQSLARRNADTLRMLDMPGQITRYIGIRATQRLVLEKALKAGRKTETQAALDKIMRAAKAIQKRLDAGFRYYGGAVVDRDRISKHIKTLASCKKLVRQTPVKLLKTWSVNSLIFHQAELIHDPSGWLNAFQVSRLYPAIKDIRRAGLPHQTMEFANHPFPAQHHLVDLRSIHQNKTGTIYLRTRFHMPRAGRGVLYYGSDGPIKVWINGTLRSTAPKACCPCEADQYHCDCTWEKGMNDIVCAFDTQHGKAWGVIMRTDYV